MAEAKTFSSDESIDDTRIHELSSAEELLGDPEPWEAWETKLVVYSVSIACVGLVILGYLVNTFILT